MRIRVPAQEACCLAGAMNCTFDAGAGRWAGVDARALTSMFRTNGLFGSDS